MSALDKRISFADVAHQTITFDGGEPAGELVLQLIDTRWMQRLRRIRQTGNTASVYMFSEHSRFGHSIGVAYLATELMKGLRREQRELVAPYERAVAAAALLHDIGHVAPGSHLAERVWSQGEPAEHEELTTKIIRTDPEILAVLESAERGLSETVCKILEEDPALPPWTKSIISGGGWNADRGNWTIVDSTMAAVSYGRYNVFALLDAFRLSATGELLIQESRLDALTHFFVARDSMYRQVYQHRVLQGIDSLCERIVLRVRDLVGNSPAVASVLGQNGVFCDEVMAAALASTNYPVQLSLREIFSMTEGWWSYHVERWSSSGDLVLADLSSRLLNRRLFKTVRLGEGDGELVERAQRLAEELGFDPRYYICPIKKADKHRGKREEAPRILMDGGAIQSVEGVEPLIQKLIERPESVRSWIAVPKEIKEKLGRSR